jgi:hypothetical protein
MEKLFAVKENLIRELGSYADKQKYTAQELMDIKYASSAVDHLCNILEKAEEEKRDDRGSKGDKQYGMYPHYWGEGNYNAMGGGNYGRQMRGANGRYMDGGQGGSTYSSNIYGHGENPVDGLRKLIRDAEDQNERRVLEDALNRLQNNR